MTDRKDLLPGRRRCREPIELMNHKLIGRSAGLLHGRLGDRAPSSRDDQVQRHRDPIRRVAKKVSQPLLGVVVEQLGA